MKVREACHNTTSLKEKAWQALDASIAPSLFIMDVVCLEATVGLSRLPYGIGFKQVPFAYICMTQYLVLSSSRHLAR